MADEGRRVDRTLSSQTHHSRDRSRILRSKNGEISKRDALIRHFSSCLKEEAATLCVSIVLDDIASFGSCSRLEAW